MRDYNEIYLSIFSVFHEIMLHAKWTSRNEDRISTFRGSLQALGGPFKPRRTVGLGTGSTRGRRNVLGYNEFWTNEIYK